MNVELIEILEKWKANDDFPNETKQFRYFPNPVVIGEFTICVVKQIIIKEMRKSVYVRVENEMYTHCHNNDDDNINPSGDKYALSILLKELDEKFMKKYQNQLIKK